jgi:potassium-transporting ATPase KdpC subunit
MLVQFRRALVLLALITVLTGLVYPLVLTAVAQLAFPREAAGSLEVRNGALIGSSLIGQPFADPAVFWSRPSATSPQPYNSLASNGSNLGPLNPALVDAVAARVKALREADPGNSAPVPADLVTASASGLDPEISVAAARYQVARVARLRGMAPAQVEALVAAHSRGRLFGFLGEPRVNVLQLNLALGRRP